MVHSGYWRLCTVWFLPSRGVVCRGFPYTVIHSSRINHIAFEVLNYIRELSNKLYRNPCLYTPYITIIVNIATAMSPIYTNGRIRWPDTLDNARLELNCTENWISEIPQVESEQSRCMELQIS